MSRGQTHGGKGGHRRPTADTFADNWSNIFGKGKEKKTLEEILGQIKNEKKNDSKN
tara:strand:+ start:587 stop:754 length:168 start_codon:yes stop_codon:yes gene_type:complete